jgi:hypothetical protein
MPDEPFIEIIAGQPIVVSIHPKTVLMVGNNGSNSPVRDPYAGESIHYLIKCPEDGVVTREAMTGYPYIPRKIFHYNIGFLYFGIRLAIHRHDGKFSRSGIISVDIA